MPPDRLLPYDEQALRDLHAWKNPKPTVLGRAGDAIERLVTAITDRVPLGMIEQVLGWVLPRMRDMTWRATSRQLVLRAYGRAGQPISSIEKIAELDLRIADAVAGDKRIHEAAVAGAEGAAAGFFGGWALAADTAGVMLLSMRAVQSRALVYGFDPSREEELAFVLAVLDAATRLGPDSKAAARSGVSAVGRRMARRAVTERAVEQVLQRMPKQLAARLAALKSESIAPVIGSVTSATFNAWYLQAVTHTARIAYRERFLRRAYGDDLLRAYGL
jgi:EcsC protein family